VESFSGVGLCGPNHDEAFNKKTEKTNAMNIASMRGIYCSIISKFFSKIDIGKSKINSLKMGVSQILWKILMKRIIQIYFLWREKILVFQERMK
jgi:hypothetical protein